jgi:cytochrome c2
LGDKVRLYAAHHFWNDAQKCFLVRVSYLEGRREELESARAALPWRTFFDTAPCLKLNTEGPRGVRFEGLENGGRMAMLTEKELLLTVGDHGFDGYNRLPSLAQDPSNSYGKILKIHLDTGQAETYSLGHRNAQGLYVDAQGHVWASEHGPRGGDELNLILPGVDYGWPQSAYGTDYTLHNWPLNPNPGRHEGYQKPVYAFVPSVGVSSLVGVSGERFDLWKDDLLIASLRMQTIWRTHLEEGRVVFAEPIQLSNRIRDLMIGHDGRLVVWTDEGDVLFIEPSRSQAGSALVSQCTGCHSLSPWDPAFLAPTLASIMGRKVASRNDFEYSGALKKLGGRWTRERLDAFLANPQAVAPGTTMQFPGIQDPEQRAKLIAYLEQLAAAH